MFLFSGRKGLNWPGLTGLTVAQAPLEPIFKRLIFVVLSACISFYAQSFIHDPTLFLQKSHLFWPTACVWEAELTEMSNYHKIYLHIYSAMMPFIHHPS